MFMYAPLPIGGKGGEGRKEEEEEANVQKSWSRQFERANSSNVKKNKKKKKVCKRSDIFGFCLLFCNQLNF